ncbi:unnamed protein product [Owenia fusiformis]|uniref:Uncharacterized protein n=1 Tax=Owenia fusiformis TaxID=6347 RepID=A0A8J1UXM0_OWEFU|nr:unnamed protein product [Owenia fusiformis]
MYKLCVVTLPCSCRIQNGDRDELIAPFCNADVFQFIEHVSVRTPFVIKYQQMMPKENGEDLKDRELPPLPEVMSQASEFNRDMDDVVRSLIIDGKWESDTDIDLAFEQHWIIEIFQVIFIVIALILGLYVLRKEKIHEKLFIRLRNVFLRIPGQEKAKKDEPNQGLE